MLKLSELRNFKVNSKYRTIPDTMVSVTLWGCYSFLCLGPTSFFFRDLVKPLFQGYLGALPPRRRMIVTLQSLARWYYTEGLKTKTNVNVWLASKHTPLSIHFQSTKWPSNVRIKPRISPFRPRSYSILPNSATPQSMYCNRHQKVPKRLERPPTPLLKESEYKEQ